MAAVRVEVLDGSNGRTVQVEVTDDGGAPDRLSPVPTAGSGFGLIGLRERVELVSGTLAAGRSGRGWCLRATLPVRATVSAS